MTHDTYRLVYYSRNQIREDAQGFPAQVQSILAASRRNNASAGVTGALLFNAGCFGQVLEGPRRAVEATFERIQRDPRHGDVSLLAFEPAERAFPSWSMGFVGSKPGDADRFAAIAGDSGFDPSRMTGVSLFQRLHGLAIEEEGGLAA